MAIFLLGGNSADDEAETSVASVEDQLRKEITVYEGCHRPESSQGRLSSGSKLNEPTQFGSFILSSGKVELELERDNSVRLIYFIEPKSRAQTRQLGYSSCH
ncbi:hypothetical protein Hdeb2414_s0006g00194161 [Helianthus debilis subsp. tardiflorus]